MKKLTIQEKEQIIELYKTGVSPKIIGDRFGVYNNSINRIVRKAGVNTKTKDVDYETTKEIISRYLAGESSEKIADDLKIVGSTVCRILKRNNVNIRPSTENKRIHKINEDFFENIDNESKAYFLGMMFADGNVHKLHGAIKLSLKTSDDEIIKKLSVLIYNKEKVEYYAGECSTCNLSIYSSKMKKDLLKLGCTPAKTFIIRLPELRSDLYRHFIRGYFDGDGCVSNASGINRIDITSNHMFIEDIYFKLMEQIPNCHIYKAKNNPTNYIQIKHRESFRRFYEYLYINATICMERKYKLYSEIVRQHS